VSFVDHNPDLLHRLPCSLLLVRNRLADVETQASRIQVHLVLGRLQDLGNVLRVLKLPQIDVRPRLLDGVTDELGRTSLTLSADDGSLLLLAGLVDNEGGSLGLLLGNLLGFDGGGEFGREGEVLSSLVTVGRV
jgi:hypothetical protein